MPTWPSLREIIRARVLPAEPRLDAQALARSVAESGGASLCGVIFFGSRKTRASPDATSAYDFFLVVREYAPFYRALARSAAFRRSPALAASLNVVLPPNQISVPSRAADASIVQVKCAVVSLAALLRETSPRRHDHFFVGRLFQQTEVVYAADEVARELLLSALTSSHALTYSWVRPWLPPRFDVEGYCRALFRVSLRGEIRPEPAGRADALWQAQQAYLHPVYGAYLADLARLGHLHVERPGETYAVPHAAGRWERLRGEAYFKWSLVRATVRWFKYMVTFDDWLEFILRKVKRHSGQDIVLTTRERRLPLIFLWPRLIRYLRQKDK